MEESTGRERPEDQRGENRIFQLQQGIAERRNDPQGEKLKRVEKFEDLRSTVTEDGELDTQVNHGVK